MRRPRSLTQLFVLGIALLGLPLLVGSIWTFVYLDRLAEGAQSLVGRGLEIGRRSEQLSAQIKDLERNARQYIVVGDRSLYDLFVERYNGLTETLEWLDLIVQEPGARKLLNEIRMVSRRSFEDMQQRAASDGALVDTGNFDTLGTLSQELQTFATRSLRARLDSTVDMASRGHTVLYWVWGVLPLLIVLLLVFVTLFIVRPLRRLDFHVRRLGRGVFDDSIEIAGPSDVSELAGRLDWLRRRLIEIENVKEQFFREMSHQVKTPLASIRQGTELLMGDSTVRSEDDRNEILEILHRNSLDLQRMLENLLGFSAWRSDPGQLFKETFRIAPILEGIVERYGVLMLSQSLRIHVDCPEDLAVHADRAKFRVVLDNLISNAIKFSPVEGTISVSVTKGGDGVVLDVVDQGPGIPPEENESVFELYYLGEQPTSGLMHGMGVGLALVRAYIEAHGGRVWFVAGEKQGAHVKAFFPEE